MQSLIFGLKDGTTGQEVPVKVDAQGRLMVAGITLEAGTVNVSSEVEVKNDTGNPIPVAAAARTCVGRQTISVTTGAVSTLTVPAGANAALIQADGSSVSMTLDGTTNPTSTVGTRLDDGVIFAVDSSLAAVKLIARTAATNVQVTYFDKA